MSREKEGLSGRVNTYKIPPGGLSSVSQLVMGSEHEENFWGHFELLQLISLKLFDVESLNGKTSESSAVKFLKHQLNFVQMKTQ